MNLSTRLYTVCHRLADAIRIIMPVLTQESYKMGRSAASFCAFTAGRRAAASSASLATIAQNICDSDRVRDDAP
jgi:hypothetical protein